MPRRLLAGLLFAAILSAAVACGGGDDTPKGTPLPSGRTPAPTAPKNASAASKLAAKFLAGVDGKYEYLYTGPIGNVTEGTLTVYRLGVNDRHDWKASPFGIESTTVTILGADTNYLCTVAEDYNFCRVAGVPELEGLRIISSPIYDALAAMVTERDKFEYDDLPDETFAGVTGKCYNASSETRIGDGAPASEAIKACFADDGAILYFERAITPDSSAIESSAFTIELQAKDEARLSDFESTGRIQ